ncbi:hypothetical protein [Kitasatospora fiedleri]|uniref:hypothetical protein n=1 Tax=Kitasatospora fiedleri TaxID=2991545 RepID=UPI00249C0C7B|nr:hypothetical protein [Kitasatospora fiedleri]
MPATPFQRYRVLPVTGEPDALVTDLWGLTDSTVADRRVAGPDGEPMTFRFFGEAVRWADEHA